MLKVQAMSQSDANKQAIQQETNRMSQILEIQKLELENMRVRLAESEKLMEERRLQNEQQLERVQMTMQTFQTPMKTESQPVVINNIIPKPSKRVGKVTMDELGNPSIELNNIDDEA
jgi:DNA repair ATPase RecN